MALTHIILSSTSFELVHERHPIKTSQQINTDSDRVILEYEYKTRTQVS